MNDLEYIKKELIFAAHNIDNTIKKRIISKEDIIDMFNKPCYEVLAYNKEMLKVQKNKNLYTLYFKPFELYYSRYIDDDLIDVLLQFAKQRYLEEIDYLDEAFSSNQISLDKYNYEVEKLQMYYLHSSLYGIYILRDIDSNRTK